jgi:hypothetical protein
MPRRSFYMEDKDLVQSSSPDSSGDQIGYETDRELVFYYNRERRLARASPEVRALNEPGPPVKSGIIRSLTATKPLLLLFISIIIIMVMILLYSLTTTPRGGGLTLGNNALKISASRSRDTTLMVITKNIAKGDDPYIGEVYIAVSPLLRASKNKETSDIPVFTERMFFTLEPQEEYRLSLPFGADEMVILLQAGNQRAAARVKPK